ncbi:MAG TPA: SGNH hydrolase domain-containing protein [Solirubrobacterales bacterium]|nr:SGNH hydrolase domain-containing protein [Solirubrobacterales bacterium]
MAQARTYIPAFSAVAVDKGPVFREGCLIYTDRITSPPCRYGVIGSEKKVVVFGDSHALQWTPALIAIARERGWEMTMLLRKNCSAAIVNYSADCNRWRLNALKRIEVEKPKLVFIASNTAPNVYVMAGTKRLNRAASEPFLRQGMFKSLMRIKKTGAAVTVMRDLPMSRDFAPSECVKENRNAPGRCSFTASRPLREAYDFAAARRFARVQVIDPLARVCPGMLCRAVDGRILKYRDRGHISATYSRSLTPWLDARLQDSWAANP